METIVVALGGNALLREGEAPTFSNQLKNVHKAAKGLAKLITKGERLVITHGNGPQVGEELIRGKYAKGKVPQMPLYIIDAETQAFIGSILEGALLDELSKLGKKGKICTIITHVLVDSKDKALRHPTKPIGPFYSRGELEAELKNEKFAYVKEEGKYRRVVGSPEPKKILELDEIKSMVKNGYVVICCGGGGIPVCKSGKSYKGVDAVIDKDSTSQLLANNIGAEKLYIFTKIDYVYSDYKHLRGPVRRMRASEIAKKLNTYEEGTWRPKMAAAARFIKNGGKEVRIGALDAVEEVVSGRSGTLIV
jgi:carbamate kinase